MQDRGELRITIGGTGGFSDVELDRLTQALLGELEAVPGLRAERVARDPGVPGAKGDGMTIADIVLTIGSAAVGGAMQPLIVTVKDWIGRQSAGLKLDITPDGGKTRITMSGTVDERTVEALAGLLAQPDAPGAAPAA